MQLEYQCGRLVVDEVFATNKAQRDIKKWAMGPYGEAGLASSLRAISLRESIFCDGVTQFCRPSAIRSGRSNHIAVTR
jgi:hypothetical protein